MKKFLSLILALMVLASSAIFTVGAADVSTAYLDGETFFYSFENESDFFHPGMKLDEQGTDNFQDPDIANYTTPGAGGSNGAVGIHVETAVSNGNTGSGIVGIQMYPGKEYELTFKIKLFSTENLKAAPKMGLFFMTSNAEVFTDAACTQSEGMVSNRYQYTTHDLGTVIPVNDGVVSDGWYTYTTKVSISNKFSSGYVPMDKPVNLNMFLRIGGVDALNDETIFTDEFLSTCGTHTYNDKERKSLWLEYALDDIGMRPASYGEKKEDITFSFNAAATSDNKVYNGAGTAEYADGLTDKGNNKSWIQTNVRLTYNLPADVEPGNYALSFDYLSAYPYGNASGRKTALQIYVDGQAVTGIIDLTPTANDWNCGITDAESYDSSDGEILIPITADSETVTIQVHNGSSLTAAGHSHSMAGQFAVKTENSFTFTKVSDIVVPVEFSFNAAATSDNKVYNGAGTAENATGLTDKGNNKSWIQTNVRLTYNLPADVEPGNYALSFDYLSAYLSNRWTALQIYVDGQAVTGIIDLDPTAKEWNEVISYAESYDSYADDEVLIPITADSKTVSIQAHNGSSLTAAGHSHSMAGGFAVKTENSFTFTKVSDIVLEEFSFNAAATSDGKVYNGAGTSEYADGLTESSNKSKINTNVRLTYNLPADVEPGNYALSFDYLSAYPYGNASGRKTALQIYVDGQAVTGIIDLDPTAKDWNEAISYAESYDSYEDDEVLIPITADSKTVSIQAHNGSSLTAAGHSHSMAGGFVVKTENSFTFTKVSDIVEPAEFTVENIQVASASGKNTLHTGDEINVTWDLVSTNETETQEANGGSLVKVYQVNGNEKALIGTAKAEEAGSATLTATAGLFGKDLVVEVLPLDVNGNYGIAASVETNIKVALAVDTSFKLSAGDSVDFSASIKSDEIKGSAKVYVAAYDIDDRLLNMTSKTLDYQNGDNSVSGNFAFTDEAVILKLFLWDSITYAPMIEAKVIEMKEVVSDPFADDDEINIVFVGDSIYANTGAGGEQNGFVYQVGEWMKEEYAEEGKTINWYNTSFGGTTTDYTFVRFQRDVLSKNPDMIFFAMTGNDGAGTDTLRNVESCINMVNEMEDKPYMMLTYFTSKSWRESPGYGEQLSKFYDIPLFNNTEAMRAAVAAGADVESLYSDSVHPNAAGYKIIAEALKEMIGTNRYFAKPAKRAEKLALNSGTYDTMEVFAAADETRVTRNGNWTAGNNYLKSTTVGDSLSFNFTGDILAFETALHQYAGKVEVWVDEELVWIDDPYYNMTGYQMTVRAGNFNFDLPYGDHKVVLKIAEGQKTAEAGQMETRIYNIFAGSWK